jgi:ankyrin repeat protein
MKRSLYSIGKAERQKLKAALSGQHVSTVRKFIQAGWRPEHLMDGDNPLSLCNYASVVKVLLNEGADVNAGKDDWTPLHINCDLGRSDIVMLLVKHGADVNRAYTKRGCPQIPFGTTPLMKAADRECLKSVRLLLKAGADLDAVDEHGHNALFRALYADSSTVAKELISHHAKLTEDAVGGPVYHGNLELLKLLIKKGANINCVFRAFEVKGLFIEGETPLGCAVSKAGHFDYSLEIIKALLKAGAKVDQPSRYYGESLPPICIAAGRGLADVVDVLRNAGSALSLQQALAGWTLEKACFIGRIGLVKLLLKSGVDVNAVGKDGKRPVEWAMQRGHTEIVKLLHKQGAKIT